MKKRKLKRQTEDQEEDQGIRIRINKRELLQILKAGSVLALAFFAPNAVKVLKDWVKEEDEWSDYYPSSLEQNTIKLLRKGLVEVTYKKNQPVVKITEKGITETLKYDLENFSVKKPGRWDGGWRMVIFDLPVDLKKEREIFRDKLKQAGFYQMQKSVYIYPFPCEKEIKFLREILEIPHYVKLILVNRVENDDELRKIFKI